MLHHKQVCTSTLATSVTEKAFSGLLQLSLTANMALRIHSGILLILCTSWTLGESNSANPFSNPVFSSFSGTQAGSISQWSPFINSGNRPSTGIGINTFSAPSSPISPINSVSSPGFGPPFAAFPNSNVLSGKTNIAKPAIVNAHFVHLGESADYYSFGSDETLLAEQTYKTDKAAMILQSDGDLVVYRLCDKALLWHTKTSGSNAQKAVMRADGNLVLLSAWGDVVWETKTAGNPGAVFLVPSSTQLEICIYSLVAKRCVYNTAFDTKMSC